MEKFIAVSVIPDGIIYRINIRHIIHYHQTPDKLGVTIYFVDGREIDISENLYEFEQKLSKH